MARRGLLPCPSSALVALLSTVKTRAVSLRPSNAKYSWTEKTTVSCTCDPAARQEPGKLAEGPLGKEKSVRRRNQSVGRLHKGLALESTANAALRYIGPIGTV